MDSTNFQNSQQPEKSTAQTDDTKSAPLRMQSSQQWEDVTQHFRQAQTHMGVGEMIHVDTFDLYTAMSAIELMDPKMDIGYGTVREVGDIQLPAKLTGRQVINIMDQLLACEMSWLDSHTLPQTVFSCVYTQRLAEIPRIDLFSFIRIEISMMYYIINLIQEEKVADEEDIISWTYGFRLRPTGMTTEEQCEQMLEQVLAEAEIEGKKENEDEFVISAIALRLRFRVRFYGLIRLLTRSSLVGFPLEAGPILTELQDLAEQWKESVTKFEVDTELIDLVFDSSMNRHLMMSTPPRTAPLFKVNEAFDYLLRILNEFQALLQLRTLALPSTNLNANKVHDEEYPRCSLQVTLHAMQYFFAEYTPTSLTRSIMSRIMIPRSWNGLFNVDTANHISLIATDIGLSPEEISTEIQIELDPTLGGIMNTFKCFCRNRSRQRQYVLRVLDWWDQYCNISMNTMTSTEVKVIEDDAEKEKKAEESGINGSQKVQSSAVPEGREPEASELLDNKSPAQLVVYELMARLMIYHWMLGFECDLYQEYEYSTVYFYVGYVFISLTRATTTLANNARQSTSLHPLRFALYIMDDACLWMCRALQSTLEALSESKLWDYSCERPGVQKSGLKAFGSERLWYNQRFGVVAGIVNGPPYADYDSYSSFRKLQEDSLRAGQDDADMVQLRLKEAASAFTLTRKKLERARRISQDCPENLVGKEALALARVAIENSVAVSQILRMTCGSQSSSDMSEKYSIDFNFNKHRHFPVLKVSNVR